MATEETVKVTAKWISNEYENVSYKNASNDHVVHMYDMAAMLLYDVDECDVAGYSCGF